MILSKILFTLHGICTGLQVSASVIDSRSLQQGWSLQATTCPSGATSCGGGACCPSSLFCTSAAQSEVAACCSTSNVCRGSIEGAPKCADSSWSLWKGLSGNGFCCEPGSAGYYSSSSSVAGSCGCSVPPGANAATLMSAGTGASSGCGATTPPTSSTKTTSSTGATTPTTSTTPKSSTSVTTSSSPTTPVSSPTSTVVGAGTRAVFAHYLVGTMTQQEANQDIKDAMAVGFDGFALNTPDVTDSYATDAIQYLFNAAASTSFKLFFSFDTSYGSGGSSMGTFASFISQYASNSAYYTVNGQIFISTFNGGTLGNSNWQSQFIQPLINNGHTPFFVPDFDDWSGWPNNFFPSWPVVQGAYSWEDAWPGAGTDISNVSSSVAANLIQQAKAAGKVYMMPVSTFQFKYLGSGQDYYRIGESNLPQRLQQVLQLQPDFVEVITWNDAGEGHYIGDFWPEQIDCCPDIQAYADGFDHSGWQQVIQPFIKAYKAGATDVSSMTSPSGSAQGAMWYRTLLTTASCSSSIANYQEAQDAINYAVLLPSDGSNYSIQVYSNNKLLQTITGKAGLNGGTVLGLQAGSASTQRLVVVNSGGSVVSSATGTKDVLTQSTNATCNWNYEVVGLTL